MRNLLRADQKIFGCLFQELIDPQILQPATYQQGMLNATSSRFIFESHCVFFFG